MISQNVREEISQSLGSQPKPYWLDTYEGVKDTGCEYWLSPPQKDEDKPIHIRYTDIANRIIQLATENKDDPQIEILTEEIQELLKGVRTTRKFGYSWVTPDELLKADTNDTSKGLRKEWWELRSRLDGKGICLFLDYEKIETSASMVHDRLIAMPHDDQYEYLRINQTRGNNHYVETEQIIRVLRNIDAEYGLRLVRAASDLVEFIIEKTVDARDIPKIRQRLHRLCPDASGLADQIRFGRVELWWD